MSRIKILPPAISAVQISGETEIFSLISLLILKYLRLFEIQVPQSFFSALLNAVQIKGACILLSDPQTLHLWRFWAFMFGNGSLKCFLLSKLPFFKKLIWTRVPGNAPLALSVSHLTSYF